MIKRLIICTFIALLSVSAAARERDIKDLLRQLDTMIENERTYEQAKLNKIQGIKSLGKNARSLEERYWNNVLLYDEYFVFDADSAMQYVNANLNIAKELGNQQWEYEWHIKRSFILSVTGLLNDALDVLSYIHPDQLSNENKIKYYGQLAYLYSHMGQLSGHKSYGTSDYDRISHVYEDSINSIITKDSPEYLWYEASANVDRNVIPQSLIETVKAAVDSCSLNSRIDAMNCYILSRLYDRTGDQTNRLRYLILSGMADVAIANRDIASINELAGILLDQGDIERAYSYVNYSQNQALRLPNRIRASSLANTASEVHQLHEKRLRNTQANLMVLLGVLFVLLVTLACLIVRIIGRSRQLKESRMKAEYANGVLTKQMEELSKSKAEREELIKNLQEANVHNKEISMTLREANYVKEECIGASFALCSSYIDRFEKYRKDILRLIKASKWKELQDEVVSSSYSNRELKDFYRNFDTLFLNIYPDFVSDFNALLRPGEQITVNPGELNTELRIYALVRLGISDSVKIAALLHCSTQTVYNYRLRIRNKAIIPKEDFAETVKSLGKYQP